MKQNLRPYFLFTLLLFGFQFYASAQDDSENDTYSNNKGDVHVTKTYINNQTNIYNKSGLSKEEKQEFEKLQESNRVIELELALVKEQIKTSDKKQQEYQNLIDARTASENRIKELEEKNKQMLRLMFEDTVYRSKLEFQYDELLKSHLQSFWEQYPNFDPYNNSKCVQVYEELAGSRVMNIVAHNFTYEYLKCNTCVRDNAGAWEGIKIGGTLYYFSGTGLNVIAGPPRKNLGQLNLFIPNVGVYTFFELREHFSAYWQLKKDRETTIAEQMRSRAVSFYKGSNKSYSLKDEPCNTNFGMLSIKNRTGYDISFWLCNGQNVPCGGTSWAKHEFVVLSGATKDYKLQESVYTYGGKMGGRTVSGLIEILACEVETVSFE